MQADRTRGDSWRFPLLAVYGLARLFPRGVRRIGETDTEFFIHTTRDAPITNRHLYEHIGPVKETPFGVLYRVRDRGRLPPD